VGRGAGGAPHPQVGDQRESPIRRTADRDRPGAGPRAVRGAGRPEAALRREGLGRSAADAEHRRGAGAGEAHHRVHLEGLPVQARLGGQVEHQRGAGVDPIAISLR
ncbi:MAG: hypothetical protein ACK559_27020, partial [bacterium]